jgi:endoglucanase
MGISSLILLFAGTVAGQSGAWGQCRFNQLYYYSERLLSFAGGGSGWTGATTCISGYVCTYSNLWYSQCLPGTAASSGTLDTSTTTTHSSITSTSATVTSGLTQFAGVNIAGFDFGCTADGTCIITGTSGPYAPLPSYGGPDGPGQMIHFVNDDHLNIFRLPVGWQFLVNGVLGGTLNSANLSEYNTLVQDCLSTGAHCIIDIHNCKNPCPDPRRGLIMNRCSLGWWHHRAGWPYKCPIRELVDTTCNILCKRFQSYIRHHE